MFLKQSLDKQWLCISCWQIFSKMKYYSHNQIETPVKKFWKPELWGKVISYLLGMLQRKTGKWDWSINSFIRNKTNKQTKTPPKPTNKTTKNPQHQGKRNPEKTQHLQQKTHLDSKPVRSYNWSFKKVSS